MSASIFTYILGILTYIGDFLYSIFTSFAGFIFSSISAALNEIFGAYANDLSGYGIYAPVVAVVTIGFGGLLIYIVLAIGRGVEDFE